MAQNIYYFLQEAAKIAVPHNFDADLRSFWLGCIGIRDDGALVSSKNGAPFSTKYGKYQKIPTVHAEGRLLRKLGRNGILFVSRVRRDNRELGMAMPCQMCQCRIKSASVKEVYFSINNEQYGKWIPSSDYYRVFNL